MTKEQAEQAVRQYGSQRKASAALAVSRKTLRAALAGAAVAASAGRAPASAAGEDTVAVSDVLAGYDAVGKVLALVKEIPAGRIRKDDSIRSELGMSRDRWRAVRSSIRVSGHVYQLPSKEYVWGSKQTIAGIPAKLRELLA